MSVEATTTVSTPATRPRAGRSSSRAGSCRRTPPGKCSAQSTCLNAARWKRTSGRARPSSVSSRAASRTSQRTWEIRASSSAAPAAVGDQRALVSVQERDVLGAEAREEGREHVRDRAAAAGDGDAAAAEALLQLQHGRDGVAALDHLLPVELVGGQPSLRTSRRLRRLSQCALDRAVAALHVGGARRVGLVDLGDHERTSSPSRRTTGSRSSSPHRREAPRRAARARPRRGRPRRRAELLDVALEGELLVRCEPEQRRVGGDEGPEERGVGRVDREAELGHALAPLQQVAPVAAQL